MRLHRILGSAIVLLLCAPQARPRAMADDAEAWRDRSPRTFRQFADALQLDRVHVAGVSAGGVEAALFAARHPDRVGRVVYLDSAYDEMLVPGLPQSRPTIARWTSRPTAA